MASDYRLISPATGTTLYLVNSSGTPLAGGSPYAPSTTPLGIRPDWTPDASEPQGVFQGGAPLANGARLSNLTNANIEETLPLVYLGSSAEGVRRAAQQLRRQIATLFAGPCLLYARPNGVVDPTYFEVETAHLIERGFSGTNTSPGEGIPNVLLDLKITRQPYGGAASLEALHSAASLTNQGTGTPDNDLALELTINPLKGDLVYEGQPLNIQFNKPTSQSASTLFLASIASRTYQSIASTASAVTNTTTGTAFTASTAIDISTLRTRRGVRLRVIGRVSTLTAPSKAQLQLTIKTASSNTLWVGPWVGLSTNTTAQLVDLQGSTLDALRVPLSNTTSVILSVSIRSTDGTAVTATLGYLEALLVYDFCMIEAASGLGASQRYQCLAAQNLSGGGWLPLVPAQALVTDGSDAPVKTAVIKGTLPRAFSGASLWVAWRESDGGHTNTDTATISISHAPLFRSIRGAG